MHEGKLNEERFNKENSTEDILNREITDEKVPTEEKKEEELKNGTNDTGENNEDMEASKAELADTKDRLLRIHAEFDNYRKRVNKEKEEWLQYSCMGLIEKLLPILDNFDLALGSMEQQNEETKKTFEGICMIIKQLQEILQKEGLQPIEALGREFDPNYHEAVLQVPAEEGIAENQVVEEFRKGYLFKEKVLRASMVKVARQD